MSSSVTFGPRTTRGVIDMMISVSSFFFPRFPSSLPRIGMLSMPSAPAKLLVSLLWSRPPMSPVSPSRKRSVPVTVRVRNVGTSVLLDSLPTFRSPPSRLNSAAISNWMSPVADTRGVSLRFTPTFL